jgi:hypothetical protein
MITDWPTVLPFGRLWFTKETRKRLPRDAVIPDRRLCGPWDLGCPWSCFYRQFLCLDKRLSETVRRLHGPLAFPPLLSCTLAANVGFCCMVFCPWRTFTFWSPCPLLVSQVSAIAKLRRAFAWPPMYIHKCNTNSSFSVVRPLPCNATCQSLSQMSILHLVGRCSL